LLQGPSQDERGVVCVDLHADAMGGAQGQKKGASNMLTRLPTERLATACWAFIVAKRTGREPASLLDFRPLRRSDTV
jgi:hypothetical protein